MYELFNEIPPTSRGAIVLPQFINARNGLRRETAKIVAYYQENVRHVTNSHMLVKLLLSLNVSLRRDPQNYVDTVKDVGLKLASSLRLTTSINQGAIHVPGEFYGPGITEVVIAYDEEFDLVDATVNWRDLCPVKVLRHPFTDMSMGIPDGKYEASEEKGVAVISINIPMLAYQYRRWEEEERSDDIGSRRRIHQFVSMYPIPNMIYSHLDIALFNRLDAVYRNRPIAPFKRNHPLAVIDYTSFIDDFINKELALQERRHLTFDQILETIPAVHSTTMLEALRLPDVLFTRQIKWALILARLPVIRFLLRLNDESDNQKNSWYLYRLRIALREIRVDHALQQALPKEVFAELQASLRDEVEAYL